MSKARHNTGSTPKFYAGGDSEAGKDVLDNGASAGARKKGGRVGHKKGGMVEGMVGKKRMDRPGRKSGGGIGANKTPLSTAAKISNASDHNADETGNASG
jgi:hypothetical protein